MNISENVCCYEPSSNKKLVYARASIQKRMRKIIRGKVNEYPNAINLNANTRFPLNPITILRMPIPNNKSNKDNEAEHHEQTNSDYDITYIILNKKYKEFNELVYHDHKRLLNYTFRSSSIIHLLLDINDPVMLNMLLYMTPRWKIKNLMNTKDCKRKVGPFYASVIMNELDCAKKFIHICADINTTEHGSRLTPLQYAIVNNQFDMARLLIENGADTNITYEPKGNRKYVAIRNERFNFDKDYACLYPPLQLAIIYRRFDIIRLLLETVNVKKNYNININFTADESSTKINFDPNVIVPVNLNQVSNMVGSALQLLCSSNTLSANDDEIIDYLIKFGVDFEVVDNYGKNILHTLAIHDNYNAFCKISKAIYRYIDRSAFWNEQDQMIIDLFNKEDEKGNTPLHYACLFRSERIARDLIKILINIDSTLIDTTNKNGDSPFYCAINGNDNNIIDMLFDNYNVSLFRSDKFNWTSLHLAIRKNNDRLITKILNDGRVKNQLLVQKDVFRKNILDFASKYGNKELSDTIRNFFIDFNSVAGNDEGENFISYLKHEIEAGNTDYVLSLINKPHCSFITNGRFCSNGSVLHTAIKARNTDIIKAILDKDENLNSLTITDYNSQTPLCAAVKLNDFRVFNAIVNHPRAIKNPLSIYKASYLTDLKSRDALHESVVFNNQDGHNITRALLETYKIHHQSKLMPKTESNKNDELILNTKFDVNGETIAITAANAGNTEFFNMLFEFGIHLNVNVIQDDETKNTPIMIAINNGNEKLAISILCVAHENYLKQLDCEYGRGSLIRKNILGETILFRAIAKGMSELSKMIIDMLTNLEILKSAKCLINHIEEYNVLHAAVEYGRFDVIKYLHENLPDRIMMELIRMKNKQGQIPLDLAIAMGIQNLKDARLSQEIIGILQGKKQLKYI